jgi:hypothetical protein
MGELEMYKVNLVGVQEVRWERDDSRVRVVTFPHHNIHKHTWTSPDGVTHNQIDHVLIDKRQHSNRCLIL